MEKIKTNNFDDLARRCKQGDESAFAELYYQYSKTLYNSIYRILGQKGEAEEVLQDSFISAFNQIESFENQSHFGNWIKRVAINKSISLLRKREVQLFSIENDHDVTDENTIDEDEYEYKLEEVKKAINQLPMGYRTVVNLYAVEGIPQEEIAELLGISHSTVRSQYHRAKITILKTLKKSGLS